MQHSGDAVVCSNGACGFENPPGAAFCAQCGAALALAVAPATQRPELDAARLPGSQESEFRAAAARVSAGATSAAGRPTEDVPAPVPARPRWPWDLPDYLATAALLTVYGLLARHFWFVTDDAYISFRYSWNWAHGNGVRYNLGDGMPVEGYSNFLWVAVGALIEALRLDITFWAPLLSTLCGGLLLVLFYRLVRVRFDVALVPAVMATALLGFSAQFAVWSTSGLETMPFALLVFITAERLLLRRGGMAPVTGAIAGVLLALVRSEGIAWTLVLLVLAVVSRLLQRQRVLRPAIVYTVAVLGVYAGYSAWRYVQFGTLVANTTLAKTAGIGVGDLVGGLAYLASHGAPSRDAWSRMGVASTQPASGPVMGAWQDAPPGAWWVWRGVCYVTVNVLTSLSWLLVVPCLAFALLPPRFAVGLAVAALSLAFPAYAVLASGDFMAFGRFLVPGLAFNALLMAWLLGSLWDAQRAELPAGLIGLLTGAAGAYVFGVRSDLWDFARLGDAPIWGFWAPLAFGAAVALVWGVVSAVRTPRCHALTIPRRVVAVALGGGAVLLAMLPIWDVNLTPELTRSRFHFRLITAFYKSERSQLEKLEENATNWATIGHALREIAQPGDSCVMGPIGAIGYYSRLNILDRFGLVTPSVAARAFDPKFMSSPGHDKKRRVEEDFYEAQPTFVEVFDPMAKAAALRQLQQLYTKYLPLYKGWRDHQTGRRPLPAANAAKIALIAYYIPDFVQVICASAPPDAPPEYMCVVRRLPNGADLDAAWQDLQNRLKALAERDEARVVRVP